MTPNKNKLEYVMSGCSFARLLFKEAQEVPEVKDFILKSFATLQIQGYRFALLYNAYAESKFGDLFKEHYSPALRNIYSDSGGLQVITQGATITPEIKKAVYENQGKYSTIAMSFDEIPLSMDGDRSDRLDTSGRWFDHGKVEECARLSGKNLLEQIEFFDKMGSSTKPILICHGNDYDTFMKWAELAASEIPLDLHDRIGGIALSSASHGRGTLEDVKRAFYYTQLPLDISHKHLHLLGVGSVYRLLPTLTFMSNGVYKDTLVSLDSTTHSSAPHFGRYLGPDGDVKFGRHVEPAILDFIYNDINKHFPMTWSKEMFFDGMTMPSKKFIEKYGTRDILIMSCIAFISNSIYNFMDSAMRVTNKEEVLKIAKERKEDAIFGSLYEVQTPDDFKHWETHVGKYCSSEKLNDGRPMTLKNFFE